MAKIELTDSDVELLNTKIGLHSLLKNEELDISKVLDDVKYSVYLREKQAKESCYSF